MQSDDEFVPSHVLTAFYGASFPLAKIHPISHHLCDIKDCLIMFSLVMVCG